VTIRVLVVDDEALVRQGLRMILESADDIDVVAEADDGSAAVEAVHARRPDVVLMDVRMPGIDGLTAAASVLRLHRPPKVIMVTTFGLDSYVFAALEAGASGFLLKDTPPRDLIAAVRVVAAGDAMLSPAVTRTLIGRFTTGGAGSRRDAAVRRVEALSDREAAVLMLVGRGSSNAEIGRELFVAEATVKAHVSRLLTKLDCANRVQLAIVAHQSGLAS
jgi:DNA-binding NarL/FixJ family response regulator